VKSGHGHAYWESLSKPQQPLIVHVDDNPINDHDSGSQRAPDLATQDQKDQRTEDDKKHPGYQVTEKKRIALSGYSEIVHEHRGLLLLRMFALVYQTVAFLFLNQARNRYPAEDAPESEPPLIKNSLLSFRPTESAAYQLC
jgi:hypothetical protein